MAASAAASAASAQRSSAGAPERRHAAAGRSTRGRAPGRKSDVGNRAAASPSSRVGLGELEGREGVQNDQRPQERCVGDAARSPARPSAGQGRQDADEQRVRAGRRRRCRRRDGIPCRDPQEPQRVLPLPWRPARCATRGDHRRRPAGTSPSLEQRHEADADHSNRRSDAKTQERPDAIANTASEARQAFTRTPRPAGTATPSQRRTLAHGGSRRGRTQSRTRARNHTASSNIHRCTLGSVSSLGRRRVAIGAGRLRPSR